MNIVKYPDKRLHEVSKEVNLFNYKYLHLFALPKMVRLTTNNNGCGLAGVQVGIMKRFFIMNVSEHITQVYNPKILHKSKTRCNMQEGCLSIPNKTPYVLRSNKINVEYRDLNFVLTCGQLTGLDAIIFQHECDHLDGKLIIDK